jgi:hypothetical protein
MNGGSPNLVPRVTHLLGAAMRFLDAFTARQITVPLSVSAQALPIVSGMPNLPWTAMRGLNDATYRFMVSNNTVMPAGAIAVQVVAPGNEYINFEAITLNLPRPLVAHPPLPARSDYLVDRSLWPTRLFKIPSGETAIVGLVRSAGAITPLSLLRVKMWPAPAPMPATPYAYTDSLGQFLFRLPGLKGSVSGGVVTSTVSVNLDIRLPPAYVTPVGPTAPALPFTISLGQVTTLSISVP